MAQQTTIGRGTPAPEPSKTESSKEHSNLSELTAPARSEKGAAQPRDSQQQQIEKKISEETERIEKARKTAFAMTDYARDELYKLKSELNSSWGDQIRQRGLSDWIVGKTVGEGDYNNARLKQAEQNLRQRTEQENLVRETTPKLEASLFQARVAYNSGDFAKAKALLVDIGATSLAFDRDKYAEENKKAQSAISEANEGRIGRANNWIAGLEVVDTVSTVATVASGVGATMTVAKLGTRVALAGGKTLAITEVHDVAKEGTKAVTELISGQTPALEQLKTAAETLYDKTKQNIVTSIGAASGVGIAGMLAGAIAPSAPVVARLVPGTTGSVQGGMQTLGGQVASGNEIDLKKVGAAMGVGLVAGTLGGVGSTASALQKELGDLAVGGTLGAVTTLQSSDLSTADGKKQLVQNVATTYLGTRLGRLAAASNKPAPESNPTPPTSKPSAAQPNGERPITGFPPPPSAPPSSERNPRPTPPPTTGPIVPPTGTSPGNTSLGAGNTPAPPPIQYTAVEQAIGRAYKEATRAARMHERRYLKEHGEAKDLSPTQKWNLAASKEDVRIRVLEQQLGSLERGQSKLASLPLEQSVLSKREFHLKKDELLAKTYARSAAAEARLAEARYRENNTNPSESRAAKIRQETFSRRFNDLADETHQTRQALDKRLNELTSDTAKETGKILAKQGQDHLKKVLEDPQPSAVAFRTEKQITEAGETSYRQAFDKYLQAQGAPPVFSLTKAQLLAVRQAEASVYGHPITGSTYDYNSKNLPTHWAHPTFREAYQTNLSEAAQAIGRVADSHYRTVALSRTGKKWHELSEAQQTKINETAAKHAQAAEDRYLKPQRTSSTEMRGIPLPKGSNKEDLLARVAKSQEETAKKEYLAKQALTEVKPAAPPELADLARPSPGAPLFAHADYRARLSEIATRQRLRQRNDTPEAQAEQLAIGHREVKRS